MTATVRRTVVASGRRQPVRKVSHRPDRLTPAARLVAVSLALGLFLHGCHGPDADHEPAVAPPAREIAP